MACDTAFRIIARRYLADLTANHEATCQGDPVALHRVRIALTHLRTTILFFSPMVADSIRTRMRAELKWLNAHLGILRDIDVAIDRLRAINKRRPQTIPSYQVWTKKRADAHRRLARALRSARYRNLIKSTADWIEHGPWSIRKGKEAARKRASPVAAYSLLKLTEWQQKLLKKSRKLAKLDTEKRHRLRLLNKKLTCSIESLEESVPGQDFFAATDHAEASAQGAESPRPVERRRERSCSGGRTRARGHPGTPAISQSQTRKEAAADSRRGLSETGWAEVSVG